MGETLQTGALRTREPRRQSQESPLSMRPEVMSDSDEGKIGDGKKGKTDPKSLPADAIQLLQMQTAQNMDVMHELVRQMSRLKTKGTGGGGGGDSDPKSSDSFNEDGMPKMRGPLYYERQKRKTQRAIKRINPPVFKGEPGRETRSPPIAHLGLVQCHWCAYRQGKAKELQTHSGFLSQRMVRGHMVQKDSRF